MTSSARPVAPRRRSAARLIAIAAALALVAVAACSTATDPGALLNIDGTFKLVAVNGMPLTYHDPDSGVDVVRGTFTIHTTSRYDFAETDSSASGISTLSSSGQWTISNNTLTLLGDDHTLYLGTLSGHHDTLTTLIGAHVGTYVRQ